MDQLRSCNRNTRLQIAEGLIAEGMIAEDTSAELPVPSKFEETLMGILLHNFLI